MPSLHDVTALLDEWSRGDRRALDRLLPLVYAELRRIAARQLRHERAGHTLQPTALVHEAYLASSSSASRLAESGALLRRGSPGDAPDSGRPRPPAGGEKAGRRSAAGVTRECRRRLPTADQIPVLALDHALSRLERLDRGLAQIVELRAFGGLTIEEAAHILKVSPSTAKREWRTAKAWLMRELGRRASRDRGALATGEGAVRGDGRTAACPSASHSWHPWSPEDDTLRRDVEALLAADAAGVDSLGTVAGRVRVVDGRAAAEPSGVTATPTAPPLPG